MVMEAVGLTASIITLVSAAALTSSTLTRLWRLQGCPSYVVSALNETEDFRASLTLVSSVLDVEQVPEDVLVEVARLLARAKHLLQNFDVFLKDKVIQAHDGSNSARPKLRGHA